VSETLHGTAVLAGALGVLIRGRPGSGKSTLAASLIGRGARLIADDRVHLSACHGRLLASAPSTVAGRIELRGRGILSLSYERSAVIRLVVDCVADSDLERLPEDHHLETVILGLALPRQPVPRPSDQAAMLVEAALAALSPQCNINLRLARVWG
jgi:serine kinase of HPr protein (carbohydrate metabolism regulator)